MIIVDDFYKFFIVFSFINHCFIPVNIMVWWYLGGVSMFLKLCYYVYKGENELKTAAKSF